MKADVSNDSGESLPGSILLRGGSVAMLVRFLSLPFYLFFWTNEDSLFCNPMMYHPHPKRTNMSS